MQYTSLAFEMLVSILFAIFAGKWLDKKFEFSFPFITISLIILVIINIIFKLFKETKPKK